jgi:hypothetical protein
VPRRSGLGAPHRPGSAGPDRRQYAVEGSVHRQGQVRKRFSHGCGRPPRVDRYPRKAQPIQPSQHGRDGAEEASGPQTRVPAWTPARNRPVRVWGHSCGCSLLDAGLGQDLLEAWEIAPAVVGQDSRLALPATSQQPMPIPISDAPLGLISTWTKSPRAVASPAWSGGPARLTGSSLPQSSRRSSVTSWLNRIEAQFTALRYFTLDGTDHTSHQQQASMIRRTRLPYPVVVRVVNEKNRPGRSCHPPATRRTNRPGLLPGPGRRRRTPSRPSGGRDRAEHGLGVHGTGRWSAELDAQLAGELEQLSCYWIWPG